MNRSEGLRRWQPWAWALVIACIVALVVWQATRSAVPAGDSPEPTQVGLTLFAIGERPPAPALEGETLDGSAFDLADLSGNVVVINVWGSWCGPCRVEAPDLVKVARENANRRVEFVGIDTRDNVAAATAFVRRFNVPYPSVFDQDGRALLEFNTLIPSAAVPSTVVVDPDGNVAATVVGVVSYSTLSGLVDDIAKSAS